MFISDSLYVAYFDNFQPFYEMLTDRPTNQQTIRLSNQQTIQPTDQQTNGSYYMCTMLKKT